IRFPESEISVVGRIAMGVKGIGLKPDDFVVSMLVVRREGMLLCVAHDGSGKKLGTGEIPVRKRGGLGTLVMPFVKGNSVVSAIEVIGGDKVKFITGEGHFHRINMDDIPHQKRGKGAHRLVNVLGGSEVVEVIREHIGGQQVEEEDIGGQQVEEEQINFLD
ncbi:uncharacterized protein METZ01_LOCUS443502, partial [marine metagenome]